MNYREQIAIERELRRVGVDLGGLAHFGDGPSALDLLAWLRRLPMAMGNAAFLRCLQTAGPLAGLAEAAGVPPADPEFHDTEADELEALLDEIERIYPPAQRPEGFGLEFPHGRTAALAALRKLPDGSSAEAVERALAEPPEGPS
jgi:hypothetical protein